VKLRLQEGGGGFLLCFRGETKASEQARMDRTGYNRHKLAGAAEEEEEAAARRGGPDGWIEVEDGPAQLTCLQLAQGFLPRTGSMRWTVTGPASWTQSPRGGQTNSVSRERIGEGGSKVRVKVVLCWLVVVDSFPSRRVNWISARRRVNGWASTGYLAVYLARARALTLVCARTE
jgi:hypothetical protein